MDAVLRVLSESEVEALVSSTVELQELAAERLPGIASDEARREHAGSWALTPKFDEFLGLDVDGELAAQIWLRYQGTYHGRPLVLVAMVNVEPAYRGKGVASELTRQVFAKLREDDAPILRAYIHGDNRPARLLAGAFGFNPVMQLVALDLAE